MTIAIPKQPETGALRWLWWRLISLPWHAIKVYPPVFLIAASAAYASSEFAAHRGIFPPPFNWAQAVAFEWIYLGALALAGARRGGYFVVTVAFGAITSALYMFLHAADKYGLLVQATSNGWLLFFAACHAVPLTAVGVAYMLLIHQHEQESAAEAAQAAQAAADEAQRVAELVACPYCGQECKNQPALYGHYRTCPKHPKRGGAQ